MTIAEGVAYGNLMSMKTKYLMRAYSALIKEEGRFEVTDYVGEDEDPAIEIGFFDTQWEENDTAYQFTDFIERSSIADKIMEAV